MDLKETFLFSPRFILIISMFIYLLYHFTEKGISEYKYYRYKHGVLIKIHKALRSIKALLLLTSLMLGSVVFISMIEYNNIEPILLVSGAGVFIALLSYTHIINIKNKDIVYLFKEGYVDRI